MSPLLTWLLDSPLHTASGKNIHFALLNLSLKSENEKQLRTQKKTEILHAVTTS